MINDILIYTSAMIPFIQYTTDLGISPKYLKDKFQIDVSELDAHGLRMPAEQFRQLVVKMQEVSGDRHLGLNIAKITRVEHAGILGYVMMNCRDVAETLDKLKKYNRITGNLSNTFSEQVGRQIKMSWPLIHQELHDINQVFSEYSPASIMTLFFELTGIELTPDEVCFNFPEPEDSRIYRETFGCDIRYNQPMTCLLYDRQLAKTPIKRPNSSLMEVFEKHARECLEQISGNSQFSNEVMRILSSRATSMPGMEQIAGEMGMSSKSLQKKLKQEGTTFRQLKDDIRTELAKSYLRTLQYSAAETGYLLGYSEPSAFSRDFKRWTGVTTRQFLSGL